MNNQVPVVKVFLRNRPHLHRKVGDKVEILKMCPRCKREPAYYKVMANRCRHCRRGVFRLNGKRGN